MTGASLAEVFQRAALASVPATHEVVVTRAVETAKSVRAARVFISTIVQAQITFVDVEATRPVATPISVKACRTAAAVVTATHLTRVGACRSVDAKASGQAAFVHVAPDGWIRTDGEFRVVAKAITIDITRATEWTHLPEVGLAARA
jgi:hypothetical protein